MTVVSTVPLFGTFFDPRYDEAQAKAAAGDSKGALALHRSLCASQSERHLQDALRLEARDNREGVLMLLKHAVAADPHNAKAWVKLATVSGGEAAIEACHAALVAVTGDLPMTVAISVRLGRLLADSGDLDKALAALEAVLPLARNDYELRFTLAGVHLERGDFAAAEPHLRACIDIRPGELRPYQSLLEILDRLDRLADAEALCCDFLLRNPPDPGMRLTLAHLLTRQRNWRDAEVACQQLIQALPDTIEPRLAYARVLEGSGRPREALAQIERCVAMVPDNADVSLLLVDMQRKLGHREAAAALLEQLRQRFSCGGAWGLDLVPTPLAGRLIFDRIGAIAEHYCTGRRALVDLTGLNLERERFAAGALVELFCMVVGKGHVDFLEHVAFPALVATEGFDEMLRTKRVVYNIYTTPADLPRLKGFLQKVEARGIPYRINVELLGFSQELYAILCLPIIDQVKRSLALGSVVVMALPDAIISGPIATVIADMKVDELVACAMPRIDSGKAYPALREALARGEKLDSRDFVRRCMGEFLHPQTFSALRNSSNCLQYRDMGGFVAAHNSTPPPLCFYARPEMLEHMLHHPLCGPTSIASFYAIDHDFIDSAQRSGNLRLIGDSDYFFWAEFTQRDRHTDFLAGRKHEDYYYPASAEAVFAHEFRWVYAPQLASSEPCRDGVEETGERNTLSGELQAAGRPRSDEVRA